MPTAHTAADFPPIKREGPYGVDISSEMEGALFDFLARGSTVTLMEARHDLAKRFNLRRIRSLGLNGIFLNAARIEAPSQAEKDRSFGCLNDDIYGPCPDAVAPLGEVEGSAEGRTDDEDVAAWGGEPDAIVAVDHLREFMVPPMGVKLLEMLIESNRRSNDPEHFNDFWMTLGIEMGFCWTTVTDLQMTGAIVTFRAEPEMATSVGPVIMADEDPAEMWLHAYCGKMVPATMRFGHREMIKAFNAGMGTSVGAEVEVDGQMLPLEHAVEVLQAKIDDMMNIAREARDTLTAALADDDTFGGFTVDGEPVE